MILAKRFEQHTGHTMVQHGKYAIEESSSSQEIDRTTALVCCLRPGQKIDMSMVFPESSSNDNTCLRCKTEASGSTDFRVQWYKTFNPIYPQAMLIILQSK
jgi:hypothetical protein